MKHLLFAVLLTAGCAGLSATALPRAEHAVNGTKSFYLAMCMVPPSGKEQVCEDGKDAVNGVIEFYDWANETFGEDE